jgi:hypothetical protein
VTSTDAVSEFAALPTRLFLDSSTLQAILRYGEFIWENVEPEPGDRAYSIGLFPDLDALRCIFQLNQRAGLDVVVSEGTYREAAAKGEWRYSAHAAEVWDHWLTRIEEYQGRALQGHGNEFAARLDGSAFGYLSAKDKLLLRDALALECHAFLTLDRKLAKNAPHLHASVGIRVLTPTDHWELLGPWAALWW